MYHKLPLHKDTQHFMNALWWRPFFSLQNHMNRVAREAWMSSPAAALIPSQFWGAEQEGVIHSQHSMQRLFSEMFNTRQMLATGWTGMRGSLKVDIAENDNHFRVRMELPGVKETDVKVAIADDALVIEGSKQEISTGSGEHYLHHECSSGPFSRTVALPEEADLKNASASFDASVLTVQVPKKIIGELVRVPLESAVEAPASSSSGKMAKKEAEAEQAKGKGKPAPLPPSSFDALRHKKTAA